MRRRERIADAASNNVGGYVPSYSTASSSLVSYLTLHPTRLSHPSLGMVDWICVLCLEGFKWSAVFTDLHT